MSAAATAALTTAARQQLLQAIGGMQGMTPEAQAALMHMVAGMGSVDQQQQQQQQQCSSPIRSSSAVSSGNVLQQGQQGLPAAPAAAGLGAAAGAAAPQTAAGDSTQELADSLTDVDGLLSSSAAASAFAALSETRHLPASPLPPLQTLQQQQEDSDTAQLGSLKGNLSVLPGSLKSQMTYKTRELAAAAGAVRQGPAGANLRLAGTICRSSSGSLVDALLSEAARVEGGLLNACLPRSDSLPDMMCGEPSRPGYVDPVPAELDAALAQGGMNSVRDCLRGIAAMDSTLLKVSVTSILCYQPHVQISGVDKGKGCSCTPRLQQLVSVFGLWCVFLLFCSRSVTVEMWAESWKATGRSYKTRRKPGASQSKAEAVSKLTDQRPPRALCVLASGWF
jgi:hypothetical protein